MKNLLSALLLLSPTAILAQDIIQVHGSGTTNPSKCYWRIMTQMMQRAKLPLHMTYRAVGSSTGQFEFIGQNNTTPFSYTAWNDFGSGDIPISTENYEALKNNNVEIAHFPFVLGAISFFHSVPGMENGSNGLNLTSCQLAKIFKREIIYWDDDEIKSDNPHLDLPFPNYPIKVARRVKGSSSTASITDYLYQSCPAEWSIDQVGATIDWPEDTMKCEGSGGMTSCIRDNEGTIGYIDSGHGHDENLVEIELQNADGNFLSSKQAGDNGIGLAAVKALEEGILPADSTHDYGHVKLLNMPGRNTWPIVAISYVYLRLDLPSTVPSPASQSLLKHFVSSLYDPDVISQCSVYGFTPVPTKVRDVALEGLEKVQIDASAPVWSVETSTIKGGGQEDYVISGKRRSGVELESSGLAGDVSSLSKAVDMLDTSDKPMLTATAAAASSVEERTFTDADAAAIQASIAMSAVSIALWVCTALFILMKKMGCC